MEQLENRLCKCSYLFTFSCCYFRLYTGKWVPQWTWWRHRHISREGAAQLKKKEYIMFTVCILKHIVTSPSSKNVRIDVTSELSTFTSIGSLCPSFYMLLILITFYCIDLIENDKSTIKRTCIYYTINF